MGKRDEKGWFTIEEMCRAFDVTRSTFHQTYRPLIPADAIRGDKAVRIHCRMAIDAWTARKLEQQSAIRVDDDALVYAGGDSPNLERVRLATAQLKEIELGEKRKTHADIGELHGGLMRYAGHVRRAGEILQRKYGPDAVDILNEAIDQAVNECNQYIKRAVGSHAEQDRIPDAQGDTDGGGSVKGAKAPGAKAVRRGRNNPPQRPISG